MPLTGAEEQQELETAQKAILCLTLQENSTAAQGPRILCVRCLAHAFPVLYFHQSTIKLLSVSCYKQRNGLAVFKSCCPAQAAVSHGVQAGLSRSARQLLRGCACETEADRTTCCMLQHSLRCWCVCLPRANLRLPGRSVCTLDFEWPWLPYCTVTVIMLMVQQ